MDSHTQIPVSLLRKYNVQGPRYTSYPPAPSWKETVGVEEYQSAIQNSSLRPQPAPLSLYIHLPFCDSLCYFCACLNFVSGRNKSFERTYLASLYLEIAWLAERIGTSRQVIQMHFGGGSPSYHDPEVFSALLSLLKSSFSIHPDAEISIEADPRDTTALHLEAWRKGGVNRISFGIQDFDPQVQKAVNRIQSFDMVQTLVRMARSLDFGGLNFDLIYGLPLQTKESLGRTLNQVLDLDPDRLAVYSFAFVPWLKKHQARLEPNLPGEEEKYALFLLALVFFTQSGYEYIGMDHFAKPHDELARARQNKTLWRNFMGYTTKAGTDLFGLGMSAISSVQGSFFQNEKDIRLYGTRVDAKGCAIARGYIPTQDDVIRGRVIQAILCHAEVQKQTLEQEFNIRFNEYFADSIERLKDLEKDGLVELSADKITPTKSGRIFLRNIAMAFDAYLPAAGQARVFSRTV